MLYCLQNLCSFLVAEKFLFSIIKLFEVARKVGVLGLMVKGFLENVLPWSEDLVAMLYHELRQLASQESPYQNPKYHVPLPFFKSLRSQTLHSLQRRIPMRKNVLWYDTTVRILTLLKS